MSALVEKKIGFDGSRTLIQGGFRAWCNAGSIFAQGIEQSYKVKKVTKVKSFREATLEDQKCKRHCHSDPAVAGEESRIISSDTPTKPIVRDVSLRST
jgi:hypothetical protein